MRFRVLGGVVAATLFAGAAALGVTASMAEGFPEPPPGHWPATAPVPPDRLVVAVAVGATGSVAADVLAPYSVFAGSPRFGVRVVAQELSPVTLSGGLHVVPDNTFAQVEAPDVVVVPAVVDWAGPGEAALREWVARQADRGALVLGVCSGAKVLAEAGVLDGRSATTFWSAVDGMRDDHPAVDWVAGRRYVEDGDVITTAGVSSGVVGALRVVERLAGPEEAERAGALAAYPGWSRAAGLDIPARGYSPADLPYVLNAAFPWGRATTGVGVGPGVDELDLAAALEVYSGSSFAQRTVPVAVAGETRTRHGLRLLAAAPADLDRLVLTADDPALTRWAAEHDVPVSRVRGFDAALTDLAVTADRASATAAGKFIEYPTAHLALTGGPWPWRPTVLLVLTVLVAGTAGLLIARRDKGKASDGGK
ncbi:DJ-1/PfpI family protein [Actinokineospora spheciospongiae]|uniref:DJ-1/PfpI family protein n=1 Tax=Actinokineospora spheciospongiae TaxID=909613 RepID=UPI000D70A79E|nr:DJ-1/PfpI family protein [Actinokineospora spheciospongiae]PWW63462.1 DJ-1/PfpI family protein [Actinokineospora spheciospongiae]